MTESIKNKIEAKHLNLSDVLNRHKYTVGYFQREYLWGKSHMEELVNDLTSAFLNEYEPGDDRVTDGVNYNNYYLGSFVVSVKEGQPRSVIDGQQRLTSLTLFMIFLNHIRRERDDKDTIDLIETVICSSLRGEKYFNIVVEDRKHCLDALFTDGVYMPKDSDGESVRNMVARYEDIKNVFDEEKISGDAFPYFIDWLKYNVVMVEILAYSDENAYTIFETMNDRGLHLTHADMLKGFVLSEFKEEKRDDANSFWKESMMALKQFNDEGETDHSQRFFQAWLRARYADTIRPAKVGSINEDFENIGAGFHLWVRQNRDKMNLANSADFERVFGREFKFYRGYYVKILDAKEEFNQDLEHVFYINRWGIAPTLSIPLMLAPLRMEDSEGTAVNKINMVARYIETFAVRRSVNFRGFASNSIRSTMYALVKEIRNKDINDLRKVLSKKLEDMPENFTSMKEFNGVKGFALHGQNKIFVKFLLARMTSWVEAQVGESTTSFSAYNDTPKGRGSKPFEVEHIWADKYNEHGHNEDFSHAEEFKNYRNRIGGLLLLQRGTNQSLGDMPYEQKVGHYIKANLLAQSLCAGAYQNNPNFTKFVKDSELPFTPHESFRKADLDARQKLYQKICEQIWKDDLS